MFYLLAALESDLTEMKERHARTAVAPTGDGKEIAGPARTVAGASADDGFHPDYRIAPGEIIKETMAALDMSVAEFTYRMDYDIYFINDLLNGNTGLTKTVARRLERVLGSPAAVWQRLEQLYHHGPNSTMEVSNADS